MAAPRPALGHYQGDSQTHLMLITICLTGNLITRSGLVSLASWAPIRVRTGNFPLRSYRLNLWGHSAIKCYLSNLFHMCNDLLLSDRKVFLIYFKQKQRSHIVIFSFISGAKQPNILVAVISCTVLWNVESKTKASYGPWPF